MWIYQALRDIQFLEVLFLITFYLDLGVYSMSEYRFFKLFFIQFFYYYYMSRHKKNYFLFVEHNVSSLRVKLHISPILGCKHLTTLDAHNVS